MDKAKRTELIRAAALTMAGQYNAAALPMYGDALSLPNRKAIIEIIRSFQRLLFPVYYGEKHLLKLPPEQYSALLMERIFDDLSAHFLKLCGGDLPKLTRSEFRIGKLFYERCFNLSVFLVESFSEHILEYS